MIRTIRHRNGTQTRIGDDYVVTIIPGLAPIEARPMPFQRATALAMGYPDEVELTREHDPLHAALADWLGLPASIALTDAAGGEADAELAALEEAAVMALQTFMRRAGIRPPWLP